MVVLTHVLDHGRDATRFLDCIQSTDLYYTITRRLILQIEHTRVHLYLNTVLRILSYRIMPVGWCARALARTGKKAASAAGTTLLLFLRRALRLFGLVIRIVRPDYRDFVGRSSTYLAFGLRLSLGLGSLFLLGGGLLTLTLTLSFGLLFRLFLLRFFGGLLFSLGFLLLGLARLFLALALFLFLFTTLLFLRTVSLLAVFLLTVFSVVAVSLAVRILLRAALPQEITGWAGHTNGSQEPVQQRRISFMD